MPLAGKIRARDLILSESRRIPRGDWLSLATAAGLSASAPPKRGAFLNLENLFLRWLPDGWFHYLPHPDQSRRFAFRRDSGELVAPGLMFTSGSALPGEILGEAGFDASNFLPALILHDWLFDQHFSTAASGTFEEARNVLLEAGTTIADQAGAGKFASDLDALRGLSGSTIAWRAWNAGPGNTLP